MIENLQQTIADYVVPPAWIVGARSMLVDRIVPRLEFLWMPQTIQPGGSLTLVRDTNGTAPEQKSRWKKLPHRFIRKDYGVPNPKGPIVDLRMNCPENWAHAQIFHLPLAQLAASWVHANPTVLLTHRTPKYVRALFEHFDFPIVATERAVHGDVITPKMESFSVVRPARRALVSGLISDLDRRRAHRAVSSDLPTKIFVVRSKTRRIINQPEIEAYLREKGFVTVLPERLGVADQIELFNAATEIVAIHGAALAPLLFRSPQQPRFDLVELLSPGSMATSYRLMTAQVGGRYVGVRGRIKPEMINAAYRFSKMYDEHTLDDFFVDLESVKAAIAILDSGGPPESVA